jgi:outer membrane receptor for ferrienterochelin and colicins
MRATRVSVVVLVTLIGGTVRAASAGHIEGRLTLPGGRGLPGVVVSIVESGDTTITDTDGQFVLPEVPNGIYHVSFALADFTATVPVTVGDGSARVDRVLDWTPRYTDTVIVKGATRRSERLVEAPSSASIVSSETIARDGGHGQLPKLLQSAPGIEVVQSGVFDFSVNMRGFNRTLNRRVLTLIDGRDPGGVLLGAQEWASYAVLPDDIAQVEIIRGPGSAVYGANAFNGVVSLLTKEPRFHQGGRAVLTGGTRASGSASGMYAGAFGRGWSYRASGIGSRTDDFYVSRTSAVEYPGLPLEQRAPHIGTWVVAGTARLDRVLARGGLWTTEAGTARIGGNVYVTGSGRAQNDVVYRPWGRTSLQTGRWQMSGFVDARRGQSTSLFTGDPFVDRSMRARAEVLRRHDLGAAKLIGGITGTFERIDTANDRGVQTILSGPHTGHETGAFGQFETKLKDRLTVVGAVRVDEGTTHPTQISPKVALAFALAANQTLRLGYGRAFQPAAYGELFPHVAVAAPVNLSSLESALAPILGGVRLGFEAVPVLAVGNAGLEPERIDSVEIGYSGVVRRQVLVSADYYQSRLQHFISTFLPQVGTSLGRLNPQYGPYRPPSALNAAQQAIVLGALRQVLPPALVAVMSNEKNGDPVFAALSLTNYGKVNARGVDLGVQYFPSAAWVADVSYSWFDFDPTRDLPDDPLTANTAPHRVGLGVAYSDPRGAVSVRYRWSDRFTWGTGILRGPVPAHGVVDVGGTLSLTTHAGLRANVANLLDHKHYELFGGDILRRRAVIDLVYRW